MSTQEFIIVVDGQETLVTDNEDEALAALDPSKGQLWAVLDGGGILRWVDTCGSWVPTSSGSRTWHASSGSWVFTFKPGVPSHGTAVATWLEVQRNVHGSNLKAGLTIYIDDSVEDAIVPADSGALDCSGNRVTFRSSYEMLTVCDKPRAVLHMRGDAEIKNVFQLDGLDIVGKLEHGKFLRDTHDDRAALYL
jgi:hypothetical protein